MIAKSLLIAKESADCLRAVCRMFEVKPDEVVGRNRSPRFVIPRHAFRELLKLRNGWSDHKIGVVTGTHWGSIWNSHKVHERLMLEDRVYKNLFEQAHYEVFKAIEQPVFKSCIPEMRKEWAA